MMGLYNACLAKKFWLVIAWISAYLCFAAVHVDVWDKSLYEKCQSQTLLLYFIHLTRI
jgi:hypothetical protein